MTTSKTKRASTTRTRQLAKKIVQAVSTPSRRAKTTKTHKKKQHTKGSLGRSLLTTAGRGLGSIVGLGEFGARAGDFFADTLGMGDYTLNSNSIMSESTQAPVFEHGDKTVLVTHSELVTDLASSVAVGTNNWLIDPTNVALFPVLSGIAQNFEQYEFKGLVFTYKPTSGYAVSGSNPALGTVILATEYDVSRPLFTNKADMEAYHFSTSCVPSVMMHHPVECNPKLDVLNDRYVSGPYRQQLAPNNALGPLNVGRNLNYVGRLQAMTVGMPADGNVIGELWVSYKVKLSIPRKIATGPIGTFHANSATALPIGNTTAFASSYNIASDTTNSLGNMTFKVSGTNSVLSFAGLPPGTRAIVTLYMQAPGGTITAPSLTFNSGLINGAYWLPASDGSAIATIASPNGQAYCILSTVVGTSNTNYTTPGNLIFSTANIAGATCLWDLSVQLIPPFNGSTYTYLTSSNPGFPGPYSDLDQLRQRIKMLEEREADHERYIRVDDSCSSTTALLRRA